MFTWQRSITASTQALVAAVVALALLTGSFLVLEPRIGLAQPNVSTFTISQDIIGEISFLVPANNAVMYGSLSGITGGTANGSSTFVVQSNNTSGYTVGIAFFDNGSGQAMQGINSLSDAIRDYPSTGGGQPTFTFSTASTSAVFGYTVESDDPADLDQSFKDDGGACDTGSGFTAERCWMEPTVASFQIIDANQEATEGATSTLFFRVHVPNNPNPPLVTDTYRATATLTALNKP